MNEEISLFERLICMYESLVLSMESDGFDNSMLECRKLKLNNFKQSLVKLRRSQLKLI